MDDQKNKKETKKPKTTEAEKLIDKEEADTSKKNKQNLKKVNAKSAHQVIYKI